MDTVDSFKRTAEDKLRINNPLFKEALKEFLGTFILIAIGDGSVAQHILSKQEGGEFLSVNWSWGLGVTLALYVAAGAHINPAVTLAFAIVGRCNWIKVPIYILAQFLGAFLASACIYGVYYEAIEDFDNGDRAVNGDTATAGIWATYPKDYLSITGGLGDQVFGTMILVLCASAITDKRNPGKPTAGLEPLFIGLTVFAIGMTYGWNCGYSINPARDFAPRLFTYCAGYGKEVWTPREGMHWWWVPVIGPFIGGVCGALIYIVVIELHHDDEEAEELGAADVNFKKLRPESQHGQPSGANTGISGVSSADNPAYELTEK